MQHSGIPYQKHGLYPQTKNIISEHPPKVNPNTLIFLPNINYPPKEWLLRRISSCLFGRISVVFELLAVFCQFFLVSHYEVTRLNLRPDGLIGFIMMAGRIVYFQHLFAFAFGIRHRYGRKQRARIRMQRMCEQLFGFGKLHYNALVYNGYPVADKAHNAQIVRYEQIGQPALLLQLAHQVQHLRTDGYVQRAYRFVRNYEFRFHYKASGYADTLTLTAGELVREAACKLRQQTNVRKRLADGGFPFFL